MKLERFDVSESDLPSLGVNKHDQDGANERVLAVFASFSVCFAR